MPEFCRGFASPVVDLWLLSIETVEPTIQNALQACLSSPEQAQLQRIHRPAAQHQFLMSRGCLRYLLSRYTGQAPAALTFVYGPKGKPELSPNEASARWPRFNLSHSGQRLLVAVSTAEAVNAIGVDIETLRLVKLLPDLCRRCLTIAEAKTVLALPHPQADHRFLRYWTGKEACLKALGLGIADSMQRFELSLGSEPLTSDLTAVAVSVPNFPDCPKQLYQWQPEPEYLAAVAVQAGTPSLEIGFRVYQTTPQALMADPALTTLLGGTDQNVV